MADEEDQDSSETVDDKSDDEERPSARNARKYSWLSQALLKEENKARVKQISKILKKADTERTSEDLCVLADSPEITKRLTKQAVRRVAVKQRSLEIKDPEEVLQKKCEQLADAIRESKNVVIYTGAGISTAASIPDYRGPNGVWTMLLKGQQPIAQDLSDAEPTTTHMCITQLEREGHICHVVSQNCDGLHLRSGYPRKKLSEVHGNMYIELCNNCKPPREYVRLFDVTEKTGLRRHATDRNCHACRKPLRDTIVHFGEKGGVKTPYRWKETGKAAEKTDLILCLGTSLKILKMYACLWCKDRRPNRRPKLYIVNLQWTPKDDSATLKINGCCDDVMQRVMDRFGYAIPQYSRNMDPIFRYATPLKHHERKHVHKKILEIPANYARKRRNTGRIMKHFLGGRRGGKTDAILSPDSNEDMKAQLLPDSNEDKGSQLSVVALEHMKQERNQKQETTSDSSHADVFNQEVTGSAAVLDMQQVASKFQSPMEVSTSNNLPYHNFSPKLHSPMNSPTKVSASDNLPYHNFGSTSKLHSPMKAGASDNLPYPDFGHPQEALSRPLDLSKSGPQGWMLPQELRERNVTSEYTRLLAASNGMPHGHLIGPCINCAANQRLGLVCSCSVLPGLQSQGIQNLPMHYMSYLGLHVLGNSGMNQLPPLPPDMWPRPFIPPVFHPADDHIDNVLKDHCYLKKKQMQNLSPKSDRSDEKDHATAHCSSLRTRRRHFQETHTPKNVSVSMCESKTDALHSTVSMEPLPALEERLTKVMETENTSVPKHRHKRSKTFQDTDVDQVDDTDDAAESTPAAKKPTLCRSLSVPGWFGKGLRIGKKKRSSKT